MPNLIELNLAFNMLSGDLSDTTFCAHPGPGVKPSPLQAINLRANKFTGTLDLHDCGQLTFLDAQVRGQRRIGQGRLGFSEWGRMQAAAAAAASVRALDWRALDRRRCSVLCRVNGSLQRQRGQLPPTGLPSRLSGVTPLACLEVCFLLRGPISLRGHHGAPSLLETNPRTTSSTGPSQSAAATRSWRCCGSATTASAAACRKPFGPCPTCSRWT
jgi:hypothetical protein